MALPGREFPPTRHSVLAALGAADPAVRARAAEALARAYWRPVYCHLRLRWGASPEDAEDLTQEFLARALERGFFEGYAPDRARFRTFVRLCLDRFAANARQAAGRQKRGGGVRLVGLDRAEVENALASRPGGDDPASLEARFEREWLRGVLGLALDRLRDRCLDRGRPEAFELFRRYDVEGAEQADRPRYRDLAAALGLPVTQVTNLLAWARREFRGAVLDALRELTADEAEFRAEARALLGADP